MGLLILLMVPLCLIFIRTRPQDMGLKPFTEYDVPRDLTHIRKAVEYTGEIKQLLVNGKVSLREVLDMVIRLRQLKKRGYSADLIAKETNERIRKVFRRLFEIDEVNAELIRPVADSYGIEMY